MGSYELHFAHQQPAALRPAAPFPSLVRLEAWGLAALLLVCISVLWLDQPWVTGLWQLLLFLAAGIIALAMPRAGAVGRPAQLLLACALPLWGAVEMLLGHTAYAYAALQNVLYWTTLPACLLLGAVLLHERKMRDSFLASLWFLAAAATALELYQILVLGRFNRMSTGYPLLSSNLYAELCELLLPAVLTTALRKGSRLWLGCSLCALMLGTSIAAGARMGTALLVLELAAVLLATRRAPGYLAIDWRRHALPMLSLLLLAPALEGTAYLTSRYVQVNPLEGRAEVLASATAMVAAHPIMGAGPGAFAVTYPQFARLETRSYVNHAHNDYLEIAVDGGVIALGLWLALIGSSLGPVLRTPWAFGVLATLVHSTCDFPLYRLPVLALLGFLLAAAGASFHSLHKGARS